MITRRSMMSASALTLASCTTPISRSGTSGSSVLADWASLADHFVCPDWFRDAKFGIWSHWGPQCVPERGDWYGRQMYIQGNSYYDFHVEEYGHPSKFGFLDIIGRWRGDKWDPADLVSKYKAAGAQYIVSMANHHDNFDTYDSRHHDWNATRVGPGIDIVGTWEREVRKAGLRFGVSNHSAHAWHWWQTAYGYDAEGPLQGRRYDAFRLTRRDGKGTWWDGLDPQRLYTGPSMVAPDGLTEISTMNAWHEAHDGQWLETLPVNNPYFAANWLARQQDLVEKYRPDLVYMDNYGLPLEQFGLDAAAHYYRQSIERDGHLDVVLTGKKLSPMQRRALVDDVERGFVQDIRPEPWQTCTCIGDWHYDRRIFAEKRYKSARQIVQRLCDIVSKNGNLLLSVPQRGDGSIDEEEEKVLAGLAGWMAVNGEAIFASRPWRVFGEGPTKAVEGMQNEDKAGAFTAKDIRFTQKKGALYAAFLEWPEGPVRILALGKGSGLIRSATLLGHGPVQFAQTERGLEVIMPSPAPAALVPILRLEGDTALFD